LAQSLFEGPNPAYPNHCMFCGPDTSLEVRSQWITHTFMKRSGGIWVPAGNGYVLQIYVRCPKCTRTYIGYHYLFKPEGIARIDGNLIPNYLGPDYDKFANYAEALRAEKAGRFEDAANHCEKAGDLDKARGLRERDKVTTVRQIHVNLNSLLDQMKQGSLVVPYKCPSCYASIKISGETTTDRLTNCPYCGTTLAITDIEKFLSSIL